MINQDKNNSSLLSVQAAIDLAKRHLVDCIYSSVKVEGLGITFPQTRQILDDVQTDVRSSDVLFVLNMRDAWKFLFENLDYPVNLMFIRQINKICGEKLIYGSGVLRESDVVISGCEYIPKIPVMAEVTDAIAIINQIKDPIERAVRFFEYLARAQLFIDGNKRVAQMVANKVLISEGVGILRIPDTKVAEFSKVLVEYYETQNEALRNYLLEKCLLLARESKIIDYKGMSFTVKEIVESLPESIRLLYTDDETCARENVDAYYSSMV